LAQIGITPDRVCAADIDETPRQREMPRPYALRMARAKAAYIDAPGSVVLAADTVVAAGRRILPKAETAIDAQACLTLLSGRRHRVITAVIVTGPANRPVERVVESVVTFSRLTDAQIDSYVRSGEWQGKAGGYAIQGLAASFVRFLSGSHSNVVGLPLFETAQLLRSIGWSLP